MSEIKSLTTKEVARLCRVSDATVKRWEEAGILKSERTSGGHRRFRVEEIARFQREMNLGLKTCHSDDSVTRVATRRRPSRNLSSSSLFHSLIGGREEETADILISSFLNGEKLPQLFDGIVTDAMCRIGDLWMNGELTVAQEHLASRTVMNAVQKLRAVIPVPEMSGNLAFAAAIESDLHELPTQLCQVILESLGWEVLNFGANTPLYSLIEEVLQHTPELVCISATMIPDLERAARDYKDFRTESAKHDVSLVLGGRAFKDERIRRRFPADFHAENFSQLSDFANVVAAK
ncbi:MAG: MerR family DNA-binding transcriptional regulator [Pyrinomonadaceae bacterium]